jgi:hypothetical protein
VRHGLDFKGGGDEKDSSPRRVAWGFTPRTVARDPRQQLDPTSARQLIASLDKRRFLDELHALTSSFAADPGNPGSYACKDCVRCANCMFCNGCEGCYGCTHCTRCVQCNNCSHCVDSTSLNACAYCVQSESCANSAYVYFSKNLSDCTYCFGCVGLAKRDFHILNVGFGRTEYFELVARLKRELGVK